LFDLDSGLVHRWGEPAHQGPGYRNGKSVEIAE
jgi:hypothetical protein